VGIGARKLSGTNSDSRDGAIMAPTQCPTLIRVRLDMQAERQWYLSREGEQYGPFSDGEVTTFHQAKKLLPTDHFWCEGFRDWQPLSALFAPQQPAAQQWQLETTQRNVVQRSPQASIAHQREEVVPQLVVADLRELSEAEANRSCPFIIRWGADTSSNMLRSSARCSHCGRKGASLQHPSWGGSTIGIQPFPVCGF
jgi:hypothetical protein